MQGQIHNICQKDNEMIDAPYSKFCSDNLILRDELAIDRTLLANERTLLSYLRSAVALLIAGVSIMHFSTEGWFWVMGLACIPIGIITGIIGVARYRRMNQSIARIRNRSETEMKQNNEKAEPWRFHGIDDLKK
jgi:putative membrane protein